MGDKKIGNYSELEKGGDPRKEMAGQRKSSSGPEVFGRKKREDGSE